MKIINECEFSEKKELIKQILKNTGLDGENITLILETDPNASKQFAHVESTKRFGIYYNVKDGEEERAPKSIVDELKAKENEHVVWIRNDVCKEDELHFCWILGHEFEHVKQRIKIPKIRELRNDLRYKYEKQNIQYTLHDLPDELSADIYARDLCKSIFGEAKTECYILEQESTPRGGLFKKIRSKKKFNLLDAYKEKLANT